MAESGRGMGNDEFHVGVLSEFENLGTPSLSCSEAICQVSLGKKNSQGYRSWKLKGMEENPQGRKPRVREQEVEVGETSGLNGLYPPAVPLAILHVPCMGSPAKQKLVWS